MKNGEKHAFVLVDVQSLIVSRQQLIKTHYQTSMIEWCVCSFAWKTSIDWLREFALQASLVGQRKSKHHCTIARRENRPRNTLILKIVKVCFSITPFLGHFPLCKNKLFRQDQIEFVSAYVNRSNAHGQSSVQRFLWHKNNFMTKAFDVFLLFDQFSAERERNYQKHSIFLCSIWYDCSGYDNKTTDDLDIYRAGHVCLSVS